MRFASLGASNAANYAGAGKAVADSAANVFDVQRKTGPDYAKLSQIAMVTQAEENITAMKTAAKVTEQGIKNLRDKTKMQHGIAVFNDKKNRFQKQRKAGAIAGLGQIAGAAFLATRNDNRKRPTNSKEKGEVLNSHLKQLQGLYDQMDANDQKGLNAGDSLINNGSNNSGGTATGGDSGKAIGGGSASPTGSAQNGQTPWGRFSNVIKRGEGTAGDSGYTTMFTGAQFSDTSRHPRQINRSGRLASDAAGAYQFLSTTWDGAKNALGLTDFSPANQEKAGRYLAQKRGINPDAVYGTKQEFAQALDKIAPEWASMPTLRTGTSYYGQGGLSLDEAWNIYNGG